MRSCSKSPIILKLIYITLLPALEAQEVKVSPEVTGVVGRDVTLPCQYIPRSDMDSINQVQWMLSPPGGENIIVIVSNGQLVSVQDSFLKGRVEIAEQSLIIRDVEKNDSGSYTCTVTAFPTGSFSGTTDLVVQDTLSEQMPLSSGVVSAIVIAVILVFVIVAAIVYLVFIRRPTVSHRVFIDAGGPVMDAARPSVIVRDEDVVYSHVKLRPSTEAPPPSNGKRTADDVTYAEVSLHQKPK
ncbi:nectin-4-like isoform X2 [Cottoperca gobio]|uniref:Nectin-4-like isoform X2 n=1 Tax=Cottoperca gobio TaxID=56716 RepID=A0A6J2RE19_COTGO|nr:nectin-4-like isoform X2 [Cottoperca gobio]